jgi:hypothetical protein
MEFLIFGSLCKKDACELDMRENEILFFLLIIIMVKSRKSGATHTAAAYLASGFIYAKVSFRYLSRFFVQGGHETSDVSRVNIAQNYF